MCDVMASGDVDSCACVRARRLQPRQCFKHYTVCPVIITAFSYPKQDALFLKVHCEHKLLMSLMYYISFHSHVLCAFHSKPAALNKRLYRVLLKNPCIRFFSKSSVNIRGNKDRIEPQRPKL